MVSRRGGRHAELIGVPEITPPPFCPVDEVVIRSPTRDVVAEEDANAVRSVGVYHIPTTPRYRVIGVLLI